MRVRWILCGAWACGVALGLFGGCSGPDILSAPFGPEGRTIREAIREFPPEKQEDFRLLEARCTVCHTLEPAFASHLTPGRWRGVVRAMERKPASRISPKDGDRIAEFLEFFWEKRRETKAALKP
jgi:hypothetical protein